MDIKDALREVIGPMTITELGERLGMSNQSAGMMFRRDLKLSTLMKLLNKFGAQLTITTSEGKVLHITSDETY